MTNKGKKMSKTKSATNSKRVIAVGNQILVRLVTHYHTGRVVEVGDGYAILEDAAWIADTGRFSDALSTGTLSEVEPCPGRVEIGLGAVVDAHPWTHDLPRVKR
jgi:hypothetical protein